MKSFKPFTAARGEFKKEHLALTVSLEEIIGSEEINQFFNRQPPDYLVLNRQDINYPIREERENECKAFKDLGDRKYLQKLNAEFYKLAKRKVAELNENLSKREKSQPEYHAVTDKIGELEKDVEALVKWFLDEGYTIPDTQTKSDNIDTPEIRIKPESSDTGDANVTNLEEKLKSEKEDKVILNRELEARNNKVALLREQTRQLRKQNRQKEYPYTKDDLMQIIDATRKQNGKKNYSKIGKELGCHHSTAMKIVQDRGLRDY